MRFLEWWASLSAWVRYPVAGLVLHGSTIGFMSLPSWGYARLFIAGWALGAILLLHGPSNADKRGYHL
jgi:hypothetical protein